MQVVLNFYNFSATGVRNFLNCLRIRTFANLRDMFNNVIIEFFWCFPAYFLKFLLKTVARKLIYRG